jgi:integrase
VFERAIVRLGLPRIRLHDLRHTHATLGLQAGVAPKVMSDRLGHATVAFTQDVYMHAIPAMAAEAAEQVASLIFGGEVAQEGVPATQDRRTVVKLTDPVLR